MKLSENNKEYIKGYANALQDIMFEVTGDNTSDKSYDPCEFSEGTMHSYAFDMKDGGRHHPLSDYESIKEIEVWMLAQATAWIRSEFLDDNYDEWRDSVKYPRVTF